MRYFDGGGGRADLLAKLVMRHVTEIEQLVPESDDPLAILAAGLDEEATELLAQDPALARLFPIALDDKEEAEQFRRAAVIEQARSRLEAAQHVLADLAVAENEEAIEIAPESLSAWVTTLAGLRASWHVRLTQSDDRLAEPSQADVEADPMTAAICGWLGYLIEDLLDEQ